MKFHIYIYIHVCWIWRSGTPLSGDKSEGIYRGYIGDFIYVFGFSGIIQYSIKYQIQNLGNELDADLISGACPESISEHPGSVFSSWPWAAGNIRFLFFKLVLFNFSIFSFSKSQPPVGPPEFRPRANTYFRWFSTYQFFQRKFGLETFFFVIFRFHDHKKASG